MSPNIKVGKVSFTFGIITLLISLSVAISVGSVPVHLSTVWSVILNKLSPEIVQQTWSKGREAIIWDIRFPRALLSMMVGSGLAIVGASLQAVTRNPLADPHLLGISSGAAFKAILALLSIYWSADSSPFRIYGSFGCNYNYTWSIKIYWCY